MITLQVKENALRLFWLDLYMRGHRLHGKPAYQSWYRNGQKEHEAYYENNRLHRLNGKPASQYWHPNGQKCSEEYCENGEFIK